MVVSSHGDQLQKMNEDVRKGIAGKKIHYGWPSFSLS